MSNCPPNRMSYFLRAKNSIDIREGHGVSVSGILCSTHIHSHLLQGALVLHWPSSMELSGGHRRKQSTRSQDFRKMGIGRNL